MHLAPDGGVYKRAESPKVEKSGSFTGKVTEKEIREEVHNALIKKQDTEEEDIDELFRTFKESEAAVPKDSGDAGECLLSRQYLWSYGGGAVGVNT